MTAMRLQGKEETGIQKFWMGLSYFLPGGGAGWAYEDSPTEKVYLVLDGEMTVKSRTEEVTLGPDGLACTWPPTKAERSSTRRTSR